MRCRHQSKRVRGDLNWTSPLVTLNSSSTKATSLAEIWPRASGLEMCDSCGTEPAIGGGVRAGALLPGAGRSDPEP